MNKLVNLISGNWLSISVGFILTRLAFHLAYIERGYIAIGSEWLVFPLTIFVFGIIRQRSIFVKEIMQTTRGGKQNGGKTT
jgi:hypothetical protein